MAKMNQNLYGAVGKIGNITVYQSNGETLAREIVRKSVTIPSKDLVTVPSV